MSTGQLGLLKQLTNSQGFSTEISVDSEAAQCRNSEETSSCQSSLVEEEEIKGYADDDDYSDEEKDDDDDDDDECSYESETLDKTENTDDYLSSESQGSAQASLEQVTKHEAPSTSLGLGKDEEMDKIQEEQNPESSNKTRKSVGFDGICKSKEMICTEVSSNIIFPQVTITESQAVHKDVSLGRKKMMRQENINLGADDGNIASVSVSKSSSTSNISATGSMHTSNEPSSGHSKRNPSMKIPSQELTPVLDDSSPRISAIKGRRQRQSGWRTPVSIDERLDQNYQELYQLMTRDVEVKGKERQLIHAYQMEQLYEKYISVSNGKIPPITLYPHNWPQCVIRRLFSPTLSTLHSTLTNYSNATSFVRPTYVIPRTALSLRNDSSMQKAKKVKESKNTKSPLKLNNQMSLQDSQKSKESSNGRILGNSFSARFVDHRLGHSTNPDILKWLNGKNQIFWKQKKEEKVQKNLEKETKRLEILMKAERRLQSQQAVYNWMQQKLKESRQSSLEEKSCEGRKTEMKKAAEAHFCHGTFAEDKKEQHENGQQVCSKRFSESQSKLKGHLKPLHGQIRTNKERKFFSARSSHFKHIENPLSYNVWTRQTVNEGCAKAFNYCDDSGGSIKSKKRTVKDQERQYSAVNSEYLGKEKENISLQENEIKLKANEERPFMRKQTTRPKTAHGTRRVRHSSNSNFLDVTEHFDKVKSDFEGKRPDVTLSSGNTSRCDENASPENFDLDKNSPENGRIERLEILEDDKKGDNGSSDSTEISWKEF